MAKTVTIANQKGGVGKSTTAHAIGMGLSYQGHKVLFVDLDAQGNLSYVLGLDEEGASAYDLLSHRVDAQKVIRTIGSVDAVAASPALHGADMEFTQTGKEYRLKEALESVESCYDYIVIDTPPALGMLTINALTASNGLIIPAQADVFSLQGVGQLHATVEAVKRYCNPVLSVWGILITRYNGRAIVSRDMVAMLSETAAQLNTRVYRAMIRENVTAREAAAARKDIFTYAPKSNAAQDYEALIDEIMRQWGE